MRFFIVLLCVFLLINVPASLVYSHKKDEISVIIELDGNPHEIKKQIERYNPTIEVVSTYSLLFQGLALKGSVKKINDIVKDTHVKGVYPVQTYKALAVLNDKNNDSFTLPHALNDTSYTGKGVKVAVIDTGIDYTHKDLAPNYKGGKDLVDLDNDPMETTVDEGMPTNHGTHVAGIIGANGKLKGVAPDVDLYAYRALGPGGVGTTIQIIAALEEAVKDDVDIINLSLGNDVNGPDYPTSLAVNEAVKRGIAVVIANGNSGPDDWTIGSPATASQAMAVGAYDKARYVPFLSAPLDNEAIHITPLPFGRNWDLKKDYQITDDTQVNVNGKIALRPLNEETADILPQLEQSHLEAVLLYEADMPIAEFMARLSKALPFPVALIADKDKEKITLNDTYYKSDFLLKEEAVAPFSSRGPVTVNWQLKPDVIAPGVNILSTVPGGYEALNGTSMAAPHVTGVIALLKEARPSWTNEQIIGALKTTARQVHINGTVEQPHNQGSGLVQAEKAINTDTIIYNPLLSFGKVQGHISERTVKVTIENKTDEEQDYSFKLPKKTAGLTWQLPQTVTIPAHAKNTIDISLKTNSKQLEPGMYDGQLSLERQDGIEFSLPYMFINQRADYPALANFSFYVTLFDEKNYKYELYITEHIKSAQVQLYDPATLMYEGELMRLEELTAGKHEGTLARKKVKQSGYYYALVLLQLEDGTYVNYDTQLFLS